MGYKGSRLPIILRVLLLLLLSFAASFIFLLTGYWTVLLWLIPLLAIMAYELVRHLEKSQREISDFLESVKNNDFSVSYDLGKSSGGDLEIKRACNDLVAIYHNLREEGEFHSRFLKALIGHVDISVVCFDDNWKVEFMNSRVKQMFGREHFFDLHDFERINPDLGNAIVSCEPGKNILLKYILKNEMQNITVRSSEFTLFEKRYRIVSFQDIARELNSQEVDSWKSLIRTVTHEVNNSVIPITNLASFVEESVIDKKGKPTDLSKLDDEETEELVRSLKTIRERSEGLVKFINSTREFTRVFKPYITEIKVIELFEGIDQLLKHQISEKGISISYTADPPDMTINADRELMGQVIINLVMNSVEAVEGVSAPSIMVSGSGNSDGSSSIEVIDNGSGIEPENLSSLFVPYYTTRSKGSGIGLSICRNIIEQHKGSIYAKSTPGKETRFIITL